MVFYLPSQNKMNEKNFGWYFLYENIYIYLWFYLINLFHFYAKKTSITINQLGFLIYVLFFYFFKIYIYRLLLLFL